MIKSDTRRRTELKLGYIRQNKEARAQAKETKNFYKELEAETMKTAHRDSDAQELREVIMIQGTSMHKIAAQRRRKCLPPNILMIKTEIYCAQMKVFVLDGKKMARGS